MGEKYWTWDHNSVMALVSEKELEMKLLKAIEIFIAARVTEGHSVDILVYYTVYLLGGGYIITVEWIQLGSRKKYFTMSSSMKPVKARRSMSLSSNRLKEVLLSFDENFIEDEKKY